MRNRAVLFGALVAVVLSFAACTMPNSRLTPRDQLLITCDGLATTMGIVKNFILDGTIDHAKTLLDIRAASVIIEESCIDNTNYAAALNSLTAQSIVLLEARLAAENAIKEGS